jgi:hypothetical protein
MSNNITPDQILTEEENKRLSRMISVKKHIYSYVDNKKLIEFLLHLIDTSGLLAFERKSDRRFLNLRNLSLSLAFDVEAAKQRYPKADYISHNMKDGESRPHVIDRRTAIVRELVVTPFVNLMNTMLRAILHGTIPEEYEHTQWIMSILPDDFETLANSINTFVDLMSKKNELEEDFFMFGLTSALTYPPEDKERPSSLDQDPGFTLEFLL